jgi:hypothetical protein
VDTYSKLRSSQRVHKFWMHMRTCRKTARKDWVATAKKLLVMEDDGAHRKIKYRVNPVVNSGVKSIALPCSSLTEEMSTVANMVTMADHTEASAVCRPDQHCDFLIHHVLYGDIYKIDPPGHIRRPRPKTYCAGLSFVNFPLLSMNLSGMKRRASGYRFSSCEMALK